MAGESEPRRLDPRLELADEAIKQAAEEIGKLVVARKPEELLSDEESGDIENWIGIAVAAGFQKGKWLSDVEHERRRLDSVHLPYGYPS